MEFILNYGWVLLVLMLVITALAYFGILAPTRLLPNKCLLFEGLYCRDFKVTPTKIALVIENGMGDFITLNNISVKTCGMPAAGSLKNGAKDIFYITDCANGNVGNKFKEDVVVIYTTQSGLAHKKKGIIIARIEEDFTLSLEDSTPPVISNIIPTNGSTLTETTITLSASTDEIAHCQYSAVSFDYGEGTDFTTTDGTAHSSQLALADGNSYTYYIKCNDSSGNFNTEAAATTFTIDTTYIPPGGGEGESEGEGQPGGGEGEGANATLTYQRAITFTEDRGIARDNPYSFSFDPNGHNQADCDDVKVYEGITEIPSNIISCSSSNVGVAINLELSASESKSFTVKYGDSAAAAPSYRTDGTEPITGRIILTGLTITVPDSSYSFAKYKKMYSKIYLWAIGSNGVIGCGSGSYCDEQTEVTDVNSYAGTSYSFNSASASANLVSGSSKNYDLVVYGQNWNKNGDNSADDYNAYLRDGGSLLFTGHRSFTGSFSISFLPSGYNADITDKDIDISEFPCDASDTSHTIGDNSLCGDWGYMYQTANTIDISGTSKYYKVWSTEHDNPTLAVAGLDSPYSISAAVGAETEV
ncbi:hypothetical protein J4209_03765 [Candidatus Woesearchaeota archaeon]|nr:hypothetical protein [Candidatus Woesearchaeota archaeon]